MHFLLVSNSFIRLARSTGLDFKRSFRARELERERKVLLPGRALPRGRWAVKVWGSGDMPEITFPTSPKVQENLRERSYSPLLFFATSLYLAQKETFLFLQRNSEHILKAEKNVCPVSFNLALLLVLWLNLHIN